jgi:hypothetical protein
MNMTVEVEVEGRAEERNGMNNLKVNYFLILAPFSFLPSLSLHSRSTGVQEYRSTVQQCNARPTFTLLY